MPSVSDIVVVGAGAAGLMTAISAGRALQRAAGLRHSTGRVVVLDAARTIGAKILVSGGGRCNVTHHDVDERQYAGGSRHTIRRVIQQFDVRRTVEFFGELGVKLKREETGKLFPVTDNARTVLGALLGEAHRVGVEIVHPWKVAGVARRDGDFVLHRADADERWHARRLVLATGGMALPKSGSDGSGYALARTLGHSMTPRVFPALVPLVVGAKSRWITGLAGISARVGVEVRSGTGKRIVRFEDDALCTHFGLSGPAIMNASRWLTEARHADRSAGLWIAWVPGLNFEQADEELLALGARTPGAWLRRRLPERLARAVCESAGVDPSSPGHRLTREARRVLAHALVEMPVDIAHDRGFVHAEATAGGVALSEVDPGSMQSRVCERLWLVGELLDVDGQIGGFNFQWAWSSGFVAGRALAEDLPG
ncbi:MAG: aminoacetone oxidase family FAD-binding enzyme [Leptolyngbya sp. PLA3]|nr:MAG: aminoacetone oxidase family FAD-binding enzyme [Cyanobacteria bacterium CYA]MCE7969120.1 aminoacetone oxidase family FAD-binding enzyme [Leptolyngbya sp. PL-A3]